MKVRVLGGPLSGKPYTVRLIGIDTPETVDPNADAECGGPEATSTTFSLSFSDPRDIDGDGLFDERGGTGALVDLTPDPSQDLFDRFDRLLSYVNVTGDAPPVRNNPAYDIGETVVASGWGKVYLYENDNFFRRYDRYDSKESEAASANVGVWAKCGGNFHR